MGMAANLTHEDHVWGRLPFLASMAKRVERGRLARLLHRLWESVRRADHDYVMPLLDCIDQEMGEGVVPASLLGEIGEVQHHLRATMNNRGNGSSTVPSPCAG
jgi:hypothetical protein